MRNGSPSGLHRWGMTRLLHNHSFTWADCSTVWGIHSFIHSQDLWSPYQVDISIPWRIISCALGSECFQVPRGGKDWSWVFSLGFLESVPWTVWHWTWVLVLLSWAGVTDWPRVSQRNMKLPLSICETWALRVSLCSPCLLLSRAVGFANTHPRLCHLGHMLLG